MPASLEYLKKFQANETFFHKQNVEEYFKTDTEQSHLTSTHKRVPKPKDVYVQTSMLLCVCASFSVSVSRSLSDTHTRTLTYTPGKTSGF